MLRILCTGDSHTWGQGAGGGAASFVPVWQGGELRLMDFAPGCYVNRLRRLVEERTGASSREWKAQELAKMAGAGFEAPCARLRSECLSLDFEGELLRLEYARSAAPCAFEIEIDGKICASRQEPAAANSNDYKIISLHLPDGGHKLALRPLTGEVALYRIESYAGPAAVINGGVGSCPTFKYLDAYFEDYAAALKPDVVLAQAHTINDWLAAAPADVYQRRLEELLRAFQNLGAGVVLMTVAPIGGAQVFQGGHAYGEYLQASRRAAENTGAILCDANRVMEAGMLGLTEEERAKWLLDDIWHPNDRGHAIYAELLYQTLVQQKLI